MIKLGNLKTLTALAVDEESKVKMLELEEKLKRLGYTYESNCNKTMNYLSLNSAKQLKEWGCKERSKRTWTKASFEGAEWKIIISPTTGKDEYNCYSLSEIICNGEMAKAFFGEDERLMFVETDTFAHHEIEKRYLPGHTAYLADMLQQNKQKEAEQYLLDNCVFNPKNK